MKRAPVQHRMGRRLADWDYGARAIYMVTLELAERGRPALAEWPVCIAAAAGHEPYWTCPLTPLGEKVLACWLRIPDYWPQIELISSVVMPDHFHGILFVRAPLRSRMSPEMAKTLGDVIRGFKTGCREAAWAPGFVDTILFRKGQLDRMVRYIRENPERLARKRANPELFRRVEDIALQLPLSGETQALHFQALGNLTLLDWPVLHSVQCSRSLLRYRRERLPTGAWRIMRDADGIPLIESSTSEFESLCEEALRLAKQGAVLVSPCLSHGEREIARRAYENGSRVIVLRNKGFAKCEKPGGTLFDICAAGKLLLLAPAAWPFVPGEVPATRESALVLNRIAQLLAVSGDAQYPVSPIIYRGPTLPDIDSLVLRACSPPSRPSPETASP